MRRVRLLRGLTALFLALYVGVGFGVPIADAVVFHLGNPTTAFPAAGGDRPVSGLHEVCLLALHTFTALPASVSAPGPVAALPHAGPDGLSVDAPRDAALDGLPASRAPPRT